jgi:hypothetical protein
MVLFEYFDVLTSRLYGMYERALGPLTDDQWHWIPDGKGNSIAFTAWHYFRTEDNIIRWIFQNRRPTVWMEGGWAERLGLPLVIQGTGMPTDEAQRLRIHETAGFLEYVSQVCASTEDFLRNWREPDFDTMITLKPVGEMTKLQLLGRQAFPHGFAHLGEIQHMRTMQGLPGIGL